MYLHISILPLFQVDYSSFLTQLQDEGKAAEESAADFEFLQAQFRTPGALPGSHGRNLLSGLPFRKKNLGLSSLKSK